MKSTFRILFYAKWEASDEAKMLPIYVRITINGTKARFSLKIRVSEKIWDAKSGRAIGHSHEALQANRYLKEIATTLGIQKRVTSHLARHTFATTVTLTNGVPIESVSKMLGHCSLKTTQIYAKIVNDKLAEDMANLSTRLQHLAM